MSEIQGDSTASASALFMASLSHAIRSRLNAVLGGMELVSQGPLPAEQARFLNTSMDEGRALLRLVNSALDLSRIDAGQLRLEDLPLDPVAIAEGALGSVVAALHDRGVAAACTIDPQTPLTLRGDPARLRQVLMILLDNARKATDSGSVSLQVTPLGLDVHGEHLSFEVLDTGRGVSPNVRSGLFDPIVPASGRADWGFSSLGLDLALCRRLVEKMGGKIEYSERSRGGSRFRFTACFRRDIEFERLIDRFAEARDKRVVLVDSDAVRRTAFAQQVRMMGIRVRVVGDGSEMPAVLASRQPVDLLLVHQDAQGAALALSAASGLRTAVLVPIGKAPLRALGALVEAPIWLSAPMRNRSFIDAVMGRPVPAIDSPELDDQQPAQTRGRVLLVEDSEANRLILSAQLQRLGCTVDAVESGTEAVRLASQRRYGLVLTDLALPDMHGLQVAEAIRKLPGDTGTVPIVAVSGDTQPSDQERCLAIGMNAYLLKPVAGIDLRRILDRHLPLNIESADSFDLAALQAMADDFGVARTVDLLQTFMRELAQRIAQIQSPTCMHPDRLAAVGKQAHALKSTARVFGAHRFGERCAELESACVAGLLEEAGRLRPIVLAESQLALEQIRQWIASQET